jgi:signal transduction histidine kinase
MRNGDIDDLELHRRLASGDRGAFDELYRRYSPTAYGLAYRLTGQQMLAQDVVQTFRASAEAAGVVLEVESSGPGQMEADPVRLAEILANLVTNAVRHSPRGGRVTVRVSPAGGWWGWTQGA